MVVFRYFNWVWDLLVVVKMSDAKSIDFDDIDLYHTIDLKKMLTTMRINDTIGFMIEQKHFVIKRDE